MSVTLLNINEKSIFDGEVVKDLAILDKTMPNVPVIVISNREDPEDHRRCPGTGYTRVHSGEHGYERRDRRDPADQDRGHLHTGQCLDGCYPQGEDADGDVHVDSDGSILEFTPRQKQVLACLREGKANKTTLCGWQMCESAVKVHVRHIMKKLRATNQTQVAFLTNNMFLENSKSSAHDGSLNSRCAAATAFH